MSASKSKPTVDFQQIVDVIPQTITVLDPDGTIIYANQAVLDYTGLTINDVMKSDFRDRVFHPQDVERLRDERQQALARGEPFENEQRARGKDGTYRWFLIRYKPLLDETGQPLRWYASGTDIDDLKRAEAKLRHDERELRQLVDSLPQHVLVLDAKGSILQVNQMMLDYLGETGAARRIEDAVAGLLRSRRLPSLGTDSGMSTAAIGDLVLGELEKVAVV